MSYVEHGPRIFLAGDNNKNININNEESTSSYRGSKNNHPLVYGDYLLPRKRSEGRLKAYESCTDIRAWSQNTLDNSKYIRELSEHAKTPGKIVPLDVVIDNVIGLGAQTQNELISCRRELRKYKSLVLTPEQNHQLQLAVPESPVGTKRSRSKPTETVSQKSEFGATVRSYSASPGRSPRRNARVDKSLQTESEYKPEKVLKSRGTSMIRLPENQTLEIEGSEEITSYTIYHNLEANSADHPETTNISNETVSRAGKDRDFASVESTSDEYTADEYDNDEEEEEEEVEGIENRQNLEAKWSTPEKSTSGTPGRTETETGTGTGTGTVSGTDYDTDDETNKATIIQKDSEIIALKNELGAKEAEIEELRDVNRLLEKTLNEKDEGIQFLKGNLMKISEQQLAGVGDEILYESERLRKQIGVCECAISELRGDLKEKASMCRAQAHEIEDLRFRVKEAELLRVERDSLARKVNEMGELLVDAEKCARALTEMKSALRERDELRCQNREQSCLLADQEDEIKRLLLLFKRLSAKYEGRQVRMKGAMETMRLEIGEKNSKICQCEEQLSSMEKEVGCLNVKLKNSLNSMDDFKVAYQDACNCADLDRDIYSQAKNALCKLNLTMVELKEYKFERENLLRQIEEMKNQIQCNDKKQNRFCCGQKPEGKYNKNDLLFSTVANYDIKLTDIPTLDLRKRKCMLQEDLEELEKELSNRMGGDNRDEKVFDDQLDVVASAKQTINRLNTAMLDLDTWECEKASMKDTIERLKIQISTLTGSEEGGGENVERRIVDQASNSLAKLSQLLNELKQYQTEREMMRKQIRNLTEALKDSQSAASCKGVTLLKQRLYDLRLENEKERLAYAEEIKNLHSKLEEAENTSSCSGVKTLRLKLREAMRAAGADSRIDEALAIHVKNSIEKVENISKEIKEVDDERTEIVKEIAKKQEEIEARNVEIVGLRKQMILESMKRHGEGDRAEEGLQELAEARRQLAMKTGLIQELEDRLQSLEFQMLGSTQEQISLTRRMKIVEQEKNKLAIDFARKSEELESKNEEVDSLIKKLDSSAKIMSDFKEIERQIGEMNPRLIALQTENERLTSEVVTLKSVLSERNEKIISLVDERAKNLDIVSKNSCSYENELNKRQKEFDRVFRANKTLTAKLLEAEAKISDLNNLISGFDAEHAKLEQISKLQGVILRLTKDKSKLEGDLRGFRTQLLTLETSNKKLEENLNRILSENESIKNEIQNLGNENIRMTSELVGEVSAKEQLSILPDKLNKDIAGLKERLRNTEEKAGNILQELKNRVEELQAKCDDDDILIRELQRVNKFHDEQSLIREEKISVLEKSNSELKAELNMRIDDLKELSVRLKKFENEKLEDKKLVNIVDNKMKIFDDISKNILDNDKADGSYTVAEITCRLNHSENENKQRKTEIYKLQCDLKSKNSEINSLREETKALSQERDALNERIREKEIQNSERLQAVKNRYEGCLKVVYENHNKSVARLQAQYEEAIKDSDYFDSESWLRSLNLKEIADLHDRICMAGTTSCSMNIPNEQQSDNNSEHNSSLSITSLQRRQHQDVNEKHQLNRKIANLENEIVQREQEARKKVYELEKAIDQEKNRSQEYKAMMKIEEEKNAELENRLILLSRKNEGTKKTNFGENSSPSSDVVDLNENENDILRRRSAYNQDRVENYGILLDQQRKMVKNLEMELMNGSPKEKVHDLRKKDFIYQCSTYKKYENN